MPKEHCIVDNLEAALVLCVEALTSIGHFTSEDRRHYICRWCALRWLVGEEEVHAPDCKRQRALAAAKGE